MTITIRSAVRSDAAALAGLVRQLNVHQREPTEYFTERTLERDVFGPWPFVEAMVAEHAGELVGYVFWHDGYDTGWAARGVYLCDIYVAPSARRLGAGRALVAAVARRARDHGRTYLWWASYPWNTEAHRFYDSLGVKNETVVAHALTHAAFEALANEGVAVADANK